MANNITQIQLGNIGYLDLQDGTSAPLNFSLAEIQDISKRQGGWSKTIICPGNANNNALLGNLFNVNIIDSTFNQNLRQPCLLLQNGIPLFKGYLQLLKVNKNSQALPNNDQIISYEVVMKDSTGDFYAALQEAYLEDIDLSQYNHKYTFSAITATSANTWADVYKYHIYDKQYNGADGTFAEYILDDFRPSVFAKAYWDRIFASVGYSYIWSGMTDTGFDKLIIPYNGEEPVIDLKYTTFRAGYSGSAAPQTYTNIPENQLLYLNPFFNDDSNQPNFDYNNVYNYSTGENTIDFWGTQQINTSFTYEVWISGITNCELYASNNPATTLDLTLLGFRNTNWIPINDANFFHFNVNGYSYSSATSPQLVYSGIGGGSYTVGVIPGDVIQNRVGLQYNVGPSYWVSGFSNVTGPLPINPANYPKFYVKIGIDPYNTDVNFIYNTPTAKLGKNSIVRMNDFIPKKIKQRDFIISIIRMFNLYITPHPDDSTTLIIQTRDEFYDSGRSLDWSKKIDISQQQSVEFLPDVVAKRILLSYKEDKDAYNKQYQDGQNEIYGQLLYEFPNEFVQDTKSIQPIFSPSPIVNNFDTRAVTGIYGPAPKTNIRILYDGGWIPGEWKFRETYYLDFVNGVFQDAIQSFDYYPYAGHMAPDPYNPNFDYDFGLNDYFFYNNWEQLTNNNLYNKYYKRFISQIETGKLLTAYFRLNEYDIMNLNLRDRIWIHDSYWFINKVIDYDANSTDGLTKVELINVDEGITFSPDDEQAIVIGGGFSWIANEGSMNPDNPANVMGPGTSQSVIYGVGNVIQDSSVRLRVAGNGNMIAGQNNNITGDFNTLQGQYINIDGSHNTLTGNSISNITINGDYNQFSNGNTNLFVFGSNNIFDNRVEDLAVFNSSNNTFGPYTSGITLINSNNITIQSGVTNVTVTNANGLTITGSNINYGSSGNTNLWAAGTGLNAIKAITTGNTNTASGNNSLAIGLSNTASGNGSFAGGSGSTANSPYSVSLGFNNQALQHSAFVAGAFNTASGYTSAAFGLGTQSMATGTLTAGQSTIANDENAVAVGYFTQATGYASNAEGTFCNANGYASHSEGGSSTTTAIAPYSHAGGYNGFSNSYAEWARSSNSSGGYGILSWFGTTSNATPTRLFLDNVSQNFNLLGGHMYYIKIMVVLKDNSTLVAKQFFGEGLVSYDGATVSIIGTFPFTSTNGDASLAATSVTLGIDNTLFTVYPNVTGIAATSINWFVRADYVRVV